MKILLVNTSIYTDILVYPLGLDYLVSYLHDSGYTDIDTLDLTVTVSSQRKQALLEKLMKNSYDVVGFSFRNLTDQLFQGSAYTSLVKNFIGFTRKILKAQSKKTKIVVGGAAFSLLPEELINTLGADYGVAGEGESAFVGLLKNLEDNIEPEKNILRSSFVYKTQQYSRGKWGYLSDYQQHDSWGNLQTKRGCSGQCLYCSYPVIEGKIFRVRDPEIVAEEFLQLEKIGFEKIYLVDATFNTPMTHAVKVMEAWLNAGTKLPWKAFYNPRWVNKDFLKLVKATNGAEQINFTIESGSPKMLTVLKKHFTVEHISKAAELCKNANIPFGFTVLLGAPGESKETIRETCHLIKRLRPDWVSISIGVYIYPKTQLAKDTQDILWSEEKDLLDTVVYPYDRDMIKKEVELGLGGSGINYMIYDELEFFKGG